MDSWATFWRKILSFPPYVVIKLTHPWSFPDAHPWKRKKITFEWWWRGATTMTLEYGTGLWTCLLVGGAAALALILKRFL